MANYTQFRLRRRTSDGTYDICHLESRATLIKRFKADGSDNGTVESALTTLESDIDALSGLTGGVSITTKADKVTTPVAGDFAGLDANGNLTDSGHKHADYALASHTHQAANVKGTASTVPVFNASGELDVSTTVSITELEYLNGVTSGIQAQFTTTNAKFANYILTSQKGVASGVVPLNADVKIDSAYLPSYVDDVIEGYYSSSKFYAESAHTTEIAGESGKIYVDLTTNKTYRYSGTTYAEISSSQLIAASSTNGNFTINGAETVVYTHPTYVGTQSTGSASVAHGGTFQAVAALTLTNGHIDGYTLETYTLPAGYTHPTYAGTKGTATATLAFGDSFAMISAVTLTNGHVASYTEKTLTLPSLPHVTDVSWAATQPTTQAENDVWMEAIS